jgi:hypothetical protein
MEQIDPVPCRRVDLGAEQLFRLVDVGLSNFKN